MVVLIGCSAFFSGSEAALFSLKGRDRRALRTGSRSRRVAVGLLADPERLLSSVLFWNLVINISYFAITSIVGIRLQKTASQSTAVLFTIVSLLAIIFFSEMLPKCAAVLNPRLVASFVGIPLAVAVRLIDPLIPTLRTVNLLSRRLIWPRFTPESYLEVSDLEHAIEISTTDAAILQQEQAVLHNIVSLCEVRADEWMRPRMQFTSFSPPVALADLEGEIPPSGYLLVTEPDSDEVAGDIRLADMVDIPSQHLERYASPVAYVPWCASVAEILEQMHSRDRDVVAVVNELGETIGILTYDDLLDAIFTWRSGRSERVLNREAIRLVREGVWQVMGIVSLRRLQRHFELTLPPTKGITVAGMLQDVLQRLPEAGDQCSFGPFQWTVIEAPLRGHLLAEMTYIAPDAQIHTPGEQDKPNAQSQQSQENTESESPTENAASETRPSDRASSSSNHATEEDTS